MSATPQYKPLPTALLGDMGWANSDESSWDLATSTALLAATGFYFASIWLIAGLQPAVQFVLRPETRRLLRSAPQ